MDELSNFTNLFGSARQHLHRSVCALNVTNGLA